MKWSNNGINNGITTDQLNNIIPTNASKTPFKKIIHKQFWTNKYEEEYEGCK